MFAIRARRKVASERDFLDAVNKVVKEGTKFSSTYVADCFACLVGCSPLVSADRCTRCIIRLRIAHYFFYILLRGNTEPSCLRRTSATKVVEFGLSAEFASKNARWYRPRTAASLEKKWGGGLEQL